MKTVVITKWLFEKCKWNHLRCINSLKIASFIKSLFWQSTISIDFDCLLQSWTGLHWKQTNIETHFSTRLNSSKINCSILHKCQCLDHGTLPKETILTNTLNVKLLMYRRFLIPSRDTLSLIILLSHLHTSPHYGNSDPHVLLLTILRNLASMRWV